MRLFKYVRAERVDVLLNQQIAFTPPDEFNDVLDTRANVLPIKSKTEWKRRAKEMEVEALRHLPPEFHALPRRQRREKERELLKGAINHLHRNADEFARQLQRDLPEAISKRFGVLCLTTNPDNKLMWGHYADGHRGFVLEFDTTNPRFAVTEEIHKVVYSKDPPIYDPVVGSQGWWKVKSKEWEYEGEYRITITLDKCEKRILPNGKVIHLKQMPLDCVKAVYAGLKMEEAKKRQLGEICRPARIDVYEAEFLDDGVRYQFRKV